jgi:hypothetical protein
MNEKNYNKLLKAAIDKASKMHTHMKSNHLNFFEGPFPLERAQEFASLLKRAHNNQLDQIQ